jgi:hypothetical protein
VLIRAVNANGPGPVSRTYQVSSALVANQAPGFTANPAVSGTTQVGSTLTTTAGTSGGSPSPTITYQWQVDADGTGSSWSDIVGATASTYILTSSELGKRVRSKVRATNGIGTPGYAEAFSGATAIITAPTSAGTISFTSVGTAGTSSMTTGTGTVSATAGAPSGTGGLLLLGRALLFHRHEHDPDAFGLDALRRATTSSARAALWCSPRRAVDPIPP